jgi:hypothetical protein
VCWFVRLYIGCILLGLGVYVLGLLVVIYISYLYVELNKNVKNMASECVCFVNVHDIV